MIHSFLLIGQSNMAGRGLIDEAIPIDNTRIKILRNGRWQKMFRPINPDRSTSGVNLAESFAESYAQKYDVDVGLICCADGGTQLTQWQPGSLLFDNAVYQARLAQRTSTIAGILWHQGESDCHSGRWQTYVPRFIEMIQALRKELDLWDVPLLVGGLGDYLADYPKVVDGETTYPLREEYPRMNENLQEIARTLPHTGFVPATGLTPKKDILHFDAKSLYEFGLRYFAEFEKLRDPNKIFAEKSHPDDALRSKMEEL